MLVCLLFPGGAGGRIPSDSLVIIKIMSKLQAMSSASARLCSICFLMQYADLAGPAFKLTPQFARLIQLLRK